LADNLKDNLVKADRVEVNIVKMIDDYIIQTGLQAPLEDLPVLRDGYDVGEMTELNLQSAGIKTIIWALGYTFDFSMVKLPVTDEDGYPIQRRGVTDYPGLYFLGLPWLYKYKSGHLVGVGEDAEFIASMIDAR
jgi:putative flavoprotein involved in K+ transport